MERIHHLYLHIPFCTWVCKYCDFNAYPVLQGLIPSYLDALIGELEVTTRRLPLGPLATVFIGGGTPSLLTGAQVSSLMQAVRTVGLAANPEVTIEVNPSNVDAERLEAWLSNGITRLSLGVQSLHAGGLRFLERLHSGEDAIGAIRLGRTGGFTNINADLLYGVPGVDAGAWMETLGGVIAEGVTHLSAYELTVEPGTRLAQEVRTGIVQMPGAEAQLDEYWAAADCLGAAGFTHYEISNWARPGFACRHNLAGWQYRPYLGCGAGAHSMFRPGDGSTERSWNVKGPHAYIRRVHSEGRSVEGRETLSPDRARGEAALIGVRLLGGTTAAQDFPVQRRELIESGLLIEADGQVRLTRRGVELANQVGAAFLA
jgi:oxygen-independent coproporphyrinogen III oxidase